MGARWARQTGGVAETVDAKVSKGRAWELAARTLRSRRFKITVVTLLLFYVASYFVLSRCGRAIAREYNAEGFLYIPCPWEAYEDSRTLETLHYALVFFYYPIWLVDHHVFGGPYWSYIPMFRIGGHHLPPPASH